MVRATRQWPAAVAATRLATTGASSSWSQATATTWPRCPSWSRSSGRTTRHRSCGAEWLRTAGTFRRPPGRTHDTCTHTKHMYTHSLTHAFEACVHVSMCLGAGARLHGLWHCGRVFIAMDRQCASPPACALHTPEQVRLLVCVAQRSSCAASPRRSGAPGGGSSSAAVPGTSCPSCELGMTSAHTFCCTRGRDALCVRLNVRLRRRGAPRRPV
mmetsp:Transcript_3820/g.10898  ORF Transcript_3820/g.10898 Transcript_3820/m.10898 type:complete len:214 (-) Transcript_3820:763-1404(-)